MIDDHSRPALTDAKGAAKYLSVSIWTLAEWRCEGRGPAFVKLGGTARPAIRYRFTDLDAFINAGLRGAKRKVAA